MLRFLGKLAAWTAVVLLAVVTAALYGAVHNQISYTVSPEYFTRFKFEQFQLVGLALPDRLRASMVGILASWFMGLPLGAIVGAVGFVHPNGRRLLAGSARALAAVVAVTLVLGLAGLTYGWLRTISVDVTEYRGWFLPPTVVDLRRFLCAGYMHNSSYLASVPALAVAVWVQLRERRRGRAV